MNKEMTTEDKQILMLLQENREEAVREIQSRYGWYLTMTAKSILRNEQDTEECVNDVLMQLWATALPDRISSFKAYLAKMVRNQALMLLRSRQRQKRGGNITFVSYEELSECIPEVDHSANDEGSDTLKEQLDIFLRGLSSVDRVLFMNRYWLSLSIPEIAKQSERSERYVSKRLFILRRQLKRHLGKEK